MNNVNMKNKMVTSTREVGNNNSTDNKNNIYRMNKGSQCNNNNNILILIMQDSLSLIDTIKANSNSNNTQLIILTNKIIYLIRVTTAIL